jgi:hypothetical protein
MLHNLTFAKNDEINLPGEMDIVKKYPISSDESKKVSRTMLKTPAFNEKNWDLF